MTFFSVPIRPLRGEAASALAPATVRANVRGFPSVVIPEKAGIHLAASGSPGMDPGFLRDDGYGGHGCARGAPLDQRDRGAEPARRRQGDLRSFGDADPAGPLNLIVEIKGYRRRDAAAKADTMKRLWVPAVNNHGGFGRWSFVELTEQYDAAPAIRAHLATLKRVRAA